MIFLLFSCKISFSLYNIIVGAALKFYHSNWCSKKLVCITQTIFDQRRNKEDYPMSVKFTTRSIFFLFIVLSLVLSACASSATATVVVEPTSAGVQPEATQPAPPTAEPTKPAERKVATFIWTQEFDTLNPLYSNMWFSSVTQQIWSCWAWDFDENNNPLPVLVKELPSLENGGLSADGKVITMKLRDDIVWSDGTPITSNDFVFTYQMIIDPKNIVASTSPYDKIDKIENPDDRTVIITFKDAYAPWLGTLWHGLLPAHVLEPVYQAEGTIDNAEWNRTPTVGCGPFVFSEWESGSFARFTPNEKYWMGKPKLDEIFFRFVPDDASQVAALKAKDGDLGTFFAYSDVPDLEAAGVNIVKVFSGYNEGIYFYLNPETSHPALRDERVRQAIVMAIDRFSISKDLLLGKTEPAISYWDKTPYIDPSLQPYPFDPEKAKQLLDDAGWVDSNGDNIRDKDGEDLTITYGTTTRLWRGWASGYRTARYVRIFYCRILPRSRYL
jgi:peptide/nickel transport system substrate-binding protein